MSGQIHDVGSIVDFWPDPAPQAGLVSITGTASVVVADSGAPKGDNHG